MRYILFLLVYSASIFSQEKIEGAKNHDLRSPREVFSIVSQKNHFKLETTSTGQYNLGYYAHDKLVNSWKVSSEQAHLFDDDFADKFIAIKYEMNPSTQESCKWHYQLSMRGETQKICDDEKEKILIIKKFVDKLEERFSSSKKV